MSSPKQILSLFSKSDMLIQTICRAEIFCVFVLQDTEHWIWQMSVNSHEVNGCISSRFPLFIYLTSFHTLNKSESLSLLPQRILLFSSWASSCHFTFMIRVIPLCLDYGFVINCKQSNPTFIYWVDVSVTVHHWYNNINIQLDATITNFTDNCSQLNMFRAIISPILRSTRVCLQLVV